MNKVVYNRHKRNLMLSPTWYKRYFEILAELNPTEKYEYKVEIRSDYLNYPLDWYDVGEVTHYLNGEFWWDGEIPCDHPALVRLVEETGGQCVRDGKAVIAELPDGVEWELLVVQNVEYFEGCRESIHEVHRSWY